MFLYYVPYIKYFVLCACTSVPVLFVYILSSLSINSNYSVRNLTIIIPKIKTIYIIIYFTCVYTIYYIHYT